MPDEVRPEVKAAALWWAERLKSPTFDNGDRSEHGFLATLMALTASKPRPPEAIEAFRMALERRLEGFIANPVYPPIRRGNPWGEMTVGVDYDPDGTLRDALRDAGIEPGPACLPWKTRMTIEPGRVTVRCGYGAENEVIYPGASDAL